MNIVKIIGCIFSLHIFNLCSGQILLSGKVVDGLTQKPLSYVSVYIPSIENGVLSDSVGNYKIASNKAFDSIRFSIVGYQIRTIAFNELTKEPFNTVCLKPIDFQLKEFLVKPSGRLKKEVCGYTKCKKNNIHSTGSSSGHLVCVFIPNEQQKDAYIKELIYIFDKSYQKDKAKIRVHLYSPNIYTIDKAPDEELLPESVVINISKTSKLVVDISKYAIQMPDNGVYIGLEWIEGMGSDKMSHKTIWLAPVFNSTNEIKEARTWSTWLSKSWKKNKGGLDGHKNPSNAMFGLTLLKQD